MSKDDIDKIALFCNVEPKAVIEETDKEFSIYEVPVSLVDHHLDQLIVEKLQLKAKPLDISAWRDMLVQMKNPAHEVTVGVVGKYIRHNDAYKSIYESLDHAGIAENTRVVVRKIEAEEIEREGAERVLSGLDGVLVPGGFDYRGSSGKIDAIRYARERKVALLRHLPGPAMRRHRIRPQRLQARGRQQHRVRPQHAAPRRRACSTSNSPSPTKAAPCG